MAQKTNPISLRLQQTNRDYDSAWYSKYNYTFLFNRGLGKTKYLTFILKQAGYPVPRGFIEHYLKKSKISLFFFNPKIFQTKKKKKFFTVRFLKKLNTNLIKKKRLEKKNLFSFLQKNRKNVRLLQRKKDKTFFFRI